MFYPLLFAPIYKEAVWGGSRMEKFGRELPRMHGLAVPEGNGQPSGHTGESWDISCRPGDMSVVENGAYKGLSFDMLINKDRAGFLGRRLAGGEGFPLLVKIIDAGDDLSVQVHSGEVGIAKNEMWYIMEAPESGSIILGLKENTTPESLRESPMDCLNALPVKKGDIVDVPAGMVHALTKGVMVAEIQQNSDTTYRLYDYGRAGLDGKPRELHLEAGLAAVDFPLNLGNISASSGNIVNPYFTVIKYNLDGVVTENAGPDVFCIFTCVEGECEINGVRLECSRSAFIPAGLSEYTLRGKAVLLKSFNTTA